jgi:hypothetical protein
MNTYNENLKSAIYRIFDDQNFEEKFEVEFKKITESLHSKEETLWIAEEMARNGKVEEAMKIVNFFVQQFYGSCNNFIDVELSKLDLKIKNGDIAGSLLSVSAQRLIPKLCDHCKVKVVFNAFFRLLLVFFALEQA